MSYEDHNNQRVRAMADLLKEEIFIELDRRVRDAEATLSSQIDNQIDKQISEHVEGYVEDEMMRQVMEREHLNVRLKHKLEAFQQRLQHYHKIPYAALVVPGFLLFWYGSWDIIRGIPVLNNGIVALFVGAALLFVTGAIYKKLIE